jgi:hypothetical protein
MEEKKSIKVAKYLESLTPQEIATDKQVRDSFIKIYETVHGKGMGEAFYMKEQFNYMKLLNENPILQECSKLSLYGSFLDLSVNGLTLDNTSKPLCYLMSRNAKVKTTNGGEAWEKRAYIKVSPTGEIFYRKRCGQIKDADNPQIVWGIPGDAKNSDIIRVGLNERGKHVVKEHERLIPRHPSAKIIGGYIRLERLDGSFECLWMDVSETDRLREYSNKQNKGTATDDRSNKLYTSFHGQIDPGFFEAKITKHAFDSYPPIKIGEFTKLETQIIEEKQEYNLSETIETKAEDVTDRSSFAESEQPTQGITIEKDDNNEAF